MCLQRSRYDWSLRRIIPVERARQTTQNGVHLVVYVLSMYVLCTCICRLGFIESQKDCWNWDLPTCSSSVGLWTGRPLRPINNQQLSLCIRFAYIRLHTNTMFESLPDHRLPEDACRLHSQQIGSKTRSLTYILINCTFISLNDF